MRFQVGKHETFRPIEFIEFAVVTPPGSFPSENSRKAWIFGRNLHENPFRRGFSVAGA